VTRPTEAPVLDARLRRCIGAVAVTGAVLSAAALPLAGLWSAFSVAVGGAVAAGNLWVLGRVIAAILPGDAQGAKTQSRGGWALVGLVKMIALVAVVWLLMRHGLVAPLSMVVGLCALPIGIAIGSLVSDRSEPDTPSPPKSGD
jgi:hypothetical protein